MICDFCQGETGARRVKKHHRYKGRLYVVENVPAEVCQECGERYFRPGTHPNKLVNTLVTASPVCRGGERNGEPNGFHVVTNGGAVKTVQSHKIRFCKDR